MIVVSKACEDANLKRVEVVTVADDDDEKRVDDSFNFCSDFEHKVWSGFEVEVWPAFCCRCLVGVMKFNLGRDSEARRS